MVHLEEMNGGVVHSADLAVKLVEVLCEAKLGRDRLVRQRPFVVVDRGTYWRVEGSWNRDGKIEGPAEFFVSIDKKDGRIRDLGSSYRWPSSRDPKDLIRQLSEVPEPEPPK